MEEARSKWQWALASLVCHVSISWWWWRGHVWGCSYYYLSVLFNLLSSYMQQQNKVLAIPLI
jgi:hypothetical protein